MPRGTPTYLSVSPTGQVTALFTGGLQLYEYQGAAIVYNEFDQITFLDPSNNPQEIIYGQLAGSGGTTHTLNLLSGTAPDPGPGGSYAQLGLANTPGVSGQSAIYVSTSDSVNNVSHLATILNSLGASSFLQVGNNLGDLLSAATARVNLGLGTIATYAATAFLQAANNLSDLANAATARANLGLGTAAQYAYGAFMPAVGTPTQPARGWATVYQPGAGGVPYEIIVVAGAAVGTQWSVYMGSSNPPLTRIAISGGAAHPAEWDTVSFTLPPFWYYELTQDVGAPPIFAVTETPL